MDNKTVTNVVFAGLGGQGVLKASDILAEVLELIHKQGQHIHRQLEKGIAVEKELADLEEETKDLHGVEIYVTPWFSESAPVGHSFSAN